MTADGVDWLGRKLGSDAGHIFIEDRAGNRAVCAHMLAQARRELRLLSRELDKPIFDQADFLSALKDLAVRSHQTRIRILLQDHAQVVGQGHRIIELARRLTSSIEIRIPSEEWLDYPKNFMLVDQHGYVHRELATRYEATADYHAPLRVQKLRARFDGIWDCALVDSELRRLYL